MRDYRRKGLKPERARLKLVRDTDGRLRTAASDDIGDIWAEQRRIKLAQAIEEDKRRAEKKTQRKARLTRLWKQPKKQSDSPRQAKELVVNISVPKLRVPDLLRLRPRWLKKKSVLVAAAIAALLGLSMVGYTLYGDNSTIGNGSGGDLNGIGDISKSKGPQYQTVLPAGKSIEQLGGWKRVSPPDKEPVFAFADQIGETQITVSQQPLPESFLKDIAGSIKTLAQQFTANEQISVRGKEVYIGTSIKGPQSVIFSTRGLLVLIKSDAKVSNDQWQRYIESID